MLLYYLPRVRVAIAVSVFLKLVSDRNVGFLLQFLLS